MPKIKQKILLRFFRNIFILKNSFDIEANKSNILQICRRFSTFGKFIYLAGIQILK